jgi:aryl-alcohol dehydrogenase-like predicted oxidoreductase
VGFLAFAPIGRGFLSGKVQHGTLDAEDSRSRDPRFSAEAMRRNQSIVDGLRRVGERHSATAAQVAIAWVLAHGDQVVPIPGTRHLRWLEENAAAVDLVLTETDLHDLEALPAPVGEMSWDSSRSARPGGAARTSRPEGADVT